MGTLLRTPIGRGFEIPAGSSFLATCCRSAASQPTDRSVEGVAQIPYSIRGTTGIAPLVLPVPSFVPSFPEGSHGPES